MKAAVGLYARSVSALRVHQSLCNNFPFTCPGDLARQVHVFYLQLKRMYVHLSNFRLRSQDTESVCLVRIEN